MIEKFRLLEEFHRTYGAHISNSPTLDLPKELTDVRQVLLEEEVAELREAVEKGDLVAVGDALSDIQYVLLGTYMTFGLHEIEDAMTREVHRSNMSKAGPDGKPILREDGKILKGPNYSKPDLKSIIENHIAELARPKITNCNRHSNCDVADKEAQSRGKTGAVHCRVDDCEDCFGC